MGGMPVWGACATLPPLLAYYFINLAVVTPFPADPLVIIQLKLYANPQTNSVCGRELGRCLHVRSRLSVRCLTNPFKPAHQRPRSKSQQEAGRH